MSFEHFSCLFKKFINTQSDFMAQNFLLLHQMSLFCKFLTQQNSYYIHHIFLLNNTRRIEDDTRTLMIEVNVKLKLTCDCVYLTTSTNTLFFPLLLLLTRTPYRFIDNKQNKPVLQSFVYFVCYIYLEIMSHWY